MSNENTLEKMAERVGNVLAIAKDGEHSMVERVVACDMTFELAFKIGTAEDTIAISDALGIDKMMLAVWGFAAAFQSIDGASSRDERTRTRPSCQMGTSFDASCRWNARGSRAFPTAGPT